MTRSIKGSGTSINVQLFQVPRLPQGLDVKKVNKSTSNAFIPENVVNADVLFRSKNDYQYMTQQVLKQLGSKQTMTTSQNRRMLTLAKRDIMDRLTGEEDPDAIEALMRMLNEVMFLLKVYRYHETSTYIV